jgi:hypothetical protein
MVNSLFSIKHSNYSILRQQQCKQKVLPKEGRSLREECKLLTIPIVLVQKQLSETFLLVSALASDGDMFHPPPDIHARKEFP